MWAIGDYRPFSPFKWVSCACVGFSLCFPFSLPCKKNGGQKCAVVAWNQLQFTSVTSERIEDEFRVPKVVRDVENREDSAVIGYVPFR